MRAAGRKVFPIAAGVLFLGAVVWALSFERTEPADFTFVNATEIKSVDPAIVSGAPEGRVLRGLYEGLVNWDPKTLAPTPGVAKLIPDGVDADGRPKWKANVSDDGRTYTFHLRDDARWSNGRLMTSDDFLYSFRRFLDPITGAEYAKQLFYVVGAENYNKAKVEVGDAVEVELLEPPAGAPPFARGEVLRGVLKEKQEIVVNAEAVAGGADEEKAYMYTVEVDGKRRSFARGAVDALPAADRQGRELIRQILPDFSTVGIKAPDERTLVMTLVNPTPYFVNLMGFYPLFPVNRECIEEHGYPAWTQPENIVTNGPFRLASRRIRDRIRMVKSDTYWDRDNVKLNVVDALAVESQTTALNLFETGVADWVTDIPGAIVPEILAKDQQDLVPSPYLGTYYYRVNVKRKPLDDVRVRKALSMAIDRNMIVERVTRAGQVPAWSFVPTEMATYTPYRPVQLVEGSIDEARALLAEAGYPDGEGFPQITLLYNTHGTHQQIAEVLQAEWKEKLNIDIKIQNQEWGAYLSSVRQIDYDMARAGWIGDYVDANTFLGMFVTDNPNNATGFSNEEYDRIIRELAPREADPEKRAEILRRAETILMEELPVIPIYYYVSTAMVRPYVKGFYRNIQDVHPLKDIYIDRDEKARILKERR